MTTPIGCSICYEPIQDLVVCAHNHPFDRKCLEIWNSVSKRPKDQCTICTKSFLKVENWTPAAHALQTQCTLYKNSHPEPHTDVTISPTITPDDSEEFDFYPLVLAVAFAIKMVWMHNYR